LTNNITVANVFLLLPRAHDDVIFYCGGSNKKGHHHELLLLEVCANL